VSRVLLDVLEGRRSRPGEAIVSEGGIPPLRSTSRRIRAADTPIGRASRLFLESLQGPRQPGRSSPDRPRCGAIAWATALTLAVAIGFAAWPVLAGGLAAARLPHQHAGTAARTGAPLAAGQVGAGGKVASGSGSSPPGGSPRASLARGLLASGGSSLPAQATVYDSGANPPALGQPVTAPSTSPPSGPAPAAPAQPPPPVTFANHQVTGLPSTGGSWNSENTGGYKNFVGPILWTQNTAATADWSLGPTSGGSRWDQVRVSVWIANTRAGAYARYTVRWTDGASHTQSFDVAQEPISGWHELGVFSIGTAAQRTGSLSIHMSYLRPYSGPACGSDCPGGVAYTVAASSAMFEWS
jgi:hypothetical protein